MLLTLQAPFVGWPMFMALKTLAIRLEDPTEQASLPDELEGITSSMSLLMEALDLIECPGGFWHVAADPAVNTLKKFKLAQGTR
tara:strand:- start:255 stop:506 length:252 start_codon:yes stop_codon:yes gene_type:complete